MKIINKYTKTVLAGVIVFCLFAFSGIAMSEPSAYVTISSSNIVTVIDTSTDTVIGTITVG
ncbi:MAG: YVTN family beta-propeller repeat-containing protein, partial [Candidatus Anammoxibacter sp.]